MIFRNSLRSKRPLVDFHVMGSISLHMVGGINDQQQTSPYILGWDLCYTLSPCFPEAAVSPGVAVDASPRIQEQFSKQ